MVKLKELLTQAQVDEFKNNGVLVVKSFYDLKTEIEPIQYGIYKIIGILVRKYQLPIQQRSFTPDTFDSGYQELITYDRKIGAEVYDAIKLIPAFIRLVASPRHDAVFAQIRGTDMPGFAAGGYGIRIDNPFEEKFRAPWHQDYPTHLRSMDGLVFWSPLIPVCQELGPVEYCVGSHKDGVVRVHSRDPKHPDKFGAYGMILENEEGIIARYPRIAPLTDPGTVVITDYLTIHASGFNYGKRSRWAMQMRYFNFNDLSGMEISWRGPLSVQSGLPTVQALRETHPELLID